MTARPPRVVTEEFGLLDGRTPVHRHVLTAGAVTAAVITRGAALQAVTVPDRWGRPGDVVLGFPDSSGYHEGPPGASYVGAVVGRYAGRIAGGRLPLNGTEYRLARTDGSNNLHGGPHGFDTRVWDAEVLGGVPPGARFTLLSEHGDQGFPAGLEVAATYRLDAAGRIWLDLEAVNREPADGPATVVNLTGHGYFDLGGEGNGGVADHVLRIPASRFTPLGDDLVPVGELAPVAGTPLDFRVPTRIGARLRDGHEQLGRAGGFDHNWVIDADAEPLCAPDPDGGPTPDGLRLALEAHHPGTGRRLRVYSDRPGLQFFAAGSFDGSMVGKSGRSYGRHAGFTAETQHFPDSPHHPAFPSTELPPGGAVRARTVYVFDTV